MDQWSKLAAAWATAALLTACGGGGADAPAVPPPPPPPNPPKIADAPLPSVTSLPSIDLTPVLSIQVHSNDVYANGTNLLEQPQSGAHWSAYIWAENVSGLPSLDGQPDRQAAAKAALMTELAQHVSGPYVVSDWDFPVANLDMKPGWRSGFANAVVAFAFMNIGENDNALTYLQPFLNSMRFTDGDRTWFPEYIDTPTGAHLDVVNGHFYAVAAMYEYWRRTGDTRFQANIQAGLQTLTWVLPEQVDETQKCFRYASGFGICDYGQQRIVLFAQAACQLYQPICAEAQVYDDDFKRWHP
jgi:hypothetical protein